MFMRAVVEHFPGEERRRIHNLPAWPGHLPVMSGRFGETSTFMIENSMYV